MNLAGLWMAGTEATMWLPPQKSVNGHKVDELFNFILYVNYFFLAVITILMIVFVIKYARGKQEESREPQPSPSHNTALELVWSIGPLFLVLYIFWVGWTGYLDLRTPPGDAFEVHVTGQKWSWTFTYPNGHVDADLLVPVGQPVRLTMGSEDVLHSFFIPAFRAKMDVVPGRYTTMWFTATEAGDYDVYCTEYCGTEHSSMGARLLAMPPAEFEAELAKRSNYLENDPPLVAGEKVYRIQGCTQCHSIDGTDGIGPSFKGIVLGQSRPLADGSQVVYDENYVRESIMEPQAKIAAGYDPVMPTYKGRLKDKAITVLIQYIKSLNDE